MKHKEDAFVKKNDANSKSQKKQKRKGYRLAAGAEIKKTSGVAKDTFLTVFEMIKSIPRLPWKKLPIQGYLYLGVVLLIIILLIIFVVPNI